MTAICAGCGEPGSPDVLAVLAAGGHAALKEACLEDCSHLASAVLDAHGQSAALEALAANSDAAIKAAAADSNVGVVEKILGVYRAAGGDHVRRVLASNDHALLREAFKKRRAVLLAVFLAAYGPPGCAEVLALVSEKQFSMLRSAITDGPRGGCMLSWMLEAVGERGSAPVLALLNNSSALDFAMTVGGRNDWDLKRTAALREVLAAYGEAGSATVLAAIGKKEVLRDTLPVRLLLVWAGRRPNPSLLAAS